MLFSSTLSLKVTKHDKGLLLLDGHVSYKVRGANSHVVSNRSKLFSFL
jgi:hypothetical protein